MIKSQTAHFLSTYIPTYIDIYKLTRPNTITLLRICAQDNHVDCVVEHTGLTYLSAAVILSTYGLCACWHCFSLILTSAKKHSRALHAYTILLATALESKAIVTETRDTPPLPKKNRH